MDFVAALGERIESRFRRENYDYRVFGRIASQALREADIVAHVSDAELLARVALDPHPLPGEAEFSDFAQTLYRGRYFFIEVLHWLSATTAIHQHSFSGAFCVLEGASLHTRFRYTPTRVINAQLALGELGWQSSVYCPRGTVVEIEAGETFIHSLYHLVEPSVTFLVRTWQEEEHTPQYTYLPGGIRIPARPLDGPKRVSLRALRILSHVDGARFEQIALDLAREASLDTIGPLIDAVATSAPDRRDALLAEIAATAHARDAAFFDALLGARKTQYRHNRLSDIRKRMTDPHARLMVAVLMNAPNRQAAIDCIRSALPGEDAVEFFVRQVRALCLPEPLLGFSCHESSWPMVEAVLRKQSLEQTIKTMKRTLGAREAARQADVIARNYHRASAYEVLQPLVV
ncbi:MAG: hypothetical protein KC503_44795 [Myxococcales bacterium]|nr:hypothetical protein [Myxococcales bacterium]